MSSFIIVTQLSFSFTPECENKQGLHLYAVCVETGSLVL